MEQKGSSQSLTLSLFGTVIPSRRLELLHILSGVCGHLPVPITERHLVFRPAKSGARTIAADQGGASQTVLDRDKQKRRVGREAQEKAPDRGVLRYVEEVESQASHQHEELDVTNVSDLTSQYSRWSLRFYDVPDPIVRTVTARKSNHIDLTQDVKGADDAMKSAETRGLSDTKDITALDPSGAYVLEAAMDVSVVHGQSPSNDLMNDAFGLSIE
ncbi:MAG: hypothetical protein Q9159_007469 [Coniocarpon cinnabarinum]